MFLLSPKDQALQADAPPSACWFSLPKCPISVSTLIHFLIQDKALCELCFPARQLGAARLKVARQTKLWEAVHQDVLTLIHHTGLAGSSERKWELNTDSEEVHGKLPPTAQQAGPYPKSELRGLKQIT